MRAARVLRNLSLKDVAAMSAPGDKLSERTLRAYESGERELTLRIIRSIASALSVPDLWFTVEDIVEAIVEAKGPEVSAETARRLATFDARIRDLERQAAEAQTPPARAGTQRRSRPRTPDR